MSDGLYRLELRNKASFEFDETYVYYEEEQDGLGEEFALEVRSKLDKIARNPYHYKNTSKNIKEALVDRFPFLITFTVNEKIKKNYSCDFSYQPQS